MIRGAAVIPKLFQKKVCKVSGFRSMYVAGGRTRLFGGAGFEVRRPLQNALRRRSRATRRTTTPRNKCIPENGQHSAYNQSFPAHLRPREILGKYIYIHTHTYMVNVKTVGPRSVHYFHHSLIHSFAHFLAYLPLHVYDMYNFSATMFSTRHSVSPTRRQSSVRYFRMNAFRDGRRNGNGKMSLFFYLFFFTASS